MLRSIRYGEADRVLHLYTADRGRVGAVAKGVRRVKSRLGGRLEPLSRVQPGAARGPRRALHGQPGRHASHAARGACASAAPRSSAATQACEAVLRLLDSSEPNPPAYNLLCHELALLDAQPGRGRPARRRSPSASSCCWRRASRPSWPSCATCGEARAPGRLLAERRRRGLRRLRGGLVPARRGGARVPGRRRSPARSPRRREAAEPRAGAGRPRDRRDARAPRARAAAARRVGGCSLERRVKTAAATKSSTSSPRARATCASCSAARARTSPR